VYSSCPTMLAALLASLSECNAGELTTAAQARQNASDADYTGELTVNVTFAVASVISRIAVEYLHG